MKYSIIHVFFPHGNGEYGYVVSPDLLKSDALRDLMVEVLIQS